LPSAIGLNISQQALTQYFCKIYQIWGNALCAAIARPNICIPINNFYISSIGIGQLILWIYLYLFSLLCADDLFNSPNPSTLLHCERFALP